MTRIVNIELSVEQYENMHLLLHNLIELAGALSGQNPVFQDMNNALRLVKTTLEPKI